jgi:hypothetical protein
VKQIFAGAVLALSPWLFSFSDTETNAWVPHVIVGILMIGYALATQTSTEEATTARS